MNHLETMDELRSEWRARKTAQRLGLRVRKSRSKIGSHNFGGFQLTDPSRNLVLDGFQFDLNTEQLTDAIERVALAR